MPRASSPWRVNAVVAYDRMRGCATVAFALMHTGVRADDPDAEAARAEMALLHQKVLGVDAYDRDAVAAVAARLEARIRELEVGS